MNACLLLAALALPLSAGARCRPACNDNWRLAVCGDSTSAPPGWVPRLTLANGVVVANLAVGGAVVSGLDAQWASAVSNPRIAVMLIGVNNCRLGHTVDSITSTLATFAAARRSSGVRVWWVHILPFGDHAEWSESAEACRAGVWSWQQSQCSQALAQCIDADATMGDLSDPARPRLKAEYTGDGIHLSEAGLTAMAAFMSTQIEALR